MNRALAALILSTARAAPLAAQDAPLSGTVARLRRFATVMGLIPRFRLSSACEACDRCVAALTACVVVALPRRTCPTVLPCIPSKPSHQQTMGSNT
ncbi:hypothetical protein GEU84_014580 [Fertoebacter nigrum]|uniref:Secreted protein n=1 Tax=Fertoeibacter niger TaxID=2656921 RepID=A0A8X8H4S9_9RHOB|nr:hypothetical protein [Fertoeibacter niger]NUB45623.1 hypothetical protein [Fertoeibacter niger]